MKLEKDPDANLDYRWDWSPWMTAGDTISSHQVTVQGGVVLGTHSHDANSVTAWISGGTVGQDAEATARITTAQGRTDDRTIRFLVRHR
jgi:hypothetical protein